MPIPNVQPNPRGKNISELLNANMTPPRRLPSTGRTAQPARSGRLNTLQKLQLRQNIHGQLSCLASELVRRFPSRPGKEKKPSLDVRSPPDTNRKKDFASATTSTTSLQSLEKYSLKSHPAANLTEFLFANSHQLQATLSLPPRIFSCTICSTPTGKP